MSSHVTGLFIVGGDMWGYYITRITRRSKIVKRAIVINSEALGRGSDELGKQLMDSFLRKLLMLPNKPDAIIFYNSGVKLLASGSPVMDALDALFKIGIDIVACGSCVTYYELNDKIAVGRVSNMQEIASILLETESVITV